MLRHIRIWVSWPKAVRAGSLVRHSAGIDKGAPTPTRRQGMPPPYGKRGPHASSGPPSTAECLKLADSLPYFCRV